jgi:hypothetical protein
MIKKVTAVFNRSFHVLLMPMAIPAGIQRAWAAAFCMED